MFVLIVAAYCVVFLATSYYYARRGGYWNPVALFGIAGFYYYLGVPLELHLRQQDIHTVQPMVFYMPDEIRVSVAMAALIALLGFVAGHHFSGLNRVLAALDVPQRERVPRSLMILIAFQAILLLSVYGLSIFKEMSYFEANELRYNDSFFSYTTRMMTLSIGVLIGVLAYQRRLFEGWGIAAVTAIVAWGFFTSDKNPLLVAAMGIGSHWLGRRSRSPSYLALYCAGALAVTVLLPAFSAFRANAAPDWQTLIGAFTLEFQDANGPMMSLSSAMSGDEQPLYGSSYVYTAVCWIPRYVWPDRPYDLAQIFAHENIQAWRPGQGLGYSLLAEAYLNFGYAGIFLQYFAIAFALNRLWLAFLPLCWRFQNISLWAASLSVLHFQMIVVMHRAPVSQVVQSCLRELSVFVIAFWLFDRAQHRVRNTSRDLGGDARHLVPSIPTA